MKKYLVLLLATIPFLVSSCLSDQEVVNDDYCYINSVSLGSIKRQVHMLDSAGNDTVIRTSYTGSNYDMLINQKTLTIENKDSLLYGSLMEAVLVDITYVGSNLYYREQADSDSIWNIYSPEDSIDLSKPVDLWLIANDGQSDRIYTLNVTVHQQEGDSLYWYKDGEEEPFLQGMSEQCALMVQGSLSVLGKRDDAITFVKRSADGVWDEVVTNLPLTANVETLVEQKDAFLLSTTDGDIFTTTNGVEWQKLSIPQHPGMVLAAATADYLYTLMDGELYRCSQNKEGEWEFQKEVLDESPVFLPLTNVNSLQMMQKNGNNRLVMVGNRAEDTDDTSVVWNKMWNEDIPESEGTWMYLLQTADNRCTLPQLEYPNLIAYDGKCLAFGGASIAGTGSREAMDALYVSEDFGITWRTDSEMHLPRALKGVEGPICSVVDDNVIWLIANGEVWRGKLNRLDFERQ